MIDHKNEPELNELKKQYDLLFNKAEEHYRRNVRRLSMCPFCGDTPKIEVCQTEDIVGFLGWYNSVRCSNCKCTMKDIDSTYDSELQAKLNSSRIVDRWNIRVYIPQKNK